MIGIWIGTALGWASTGDTAPLAEVYVLEMRQVSEARVPVLGKTRSTMVSRSLVRTARHAGGVTAEITPCSVELASKSALAKTVIPDAFVAALGTHVFDVVLSDGVGVEPQWGLVLDMGVSYVGYDGVRSPEGVPEDASHPAVTDWDGDGRPGATVQIKVTGRRSPYGIEVAQRSHAVLRGQLGADGGVSGRVEMRLLQQSVLGADHALLRSSPEVRSLPGSTFTMLPLPPQSSCMSLDKGEAI